MKRVLFVIPYLVEGGTERALSNLTTYFPKEWEIDILVNNDKGRAYSFRGNVITLGITGKSKTGSVFFQARVFFKRVRRLRKLKKLGNYQACVSFLDSANVANILSGKSFCKVIVSVRSSLQQQSKLPQYKYIVTPLVKLFYNHADRVIAVSKGIEVELIKVFGIRKDKIHVIENGYDVNKIQSDSSEALSADENKRIANRKLVVTTGRLTDAKGQWHLVRAFSEVIKKIPNAFLIIIGSGELEDYLKDLVSGYGLIESVYFTGHVANPYKYMVQADVFVLPSLYEGFPNALAEAVCLGLPCIATDFRTGARELLSPDKDLTENGLQYIKGVQYGILTPLCSGKQYRNIEESLEKAEKQLAEAIIKLLQDEEKRKQYMLKSQIRSETLRIDTMVSKWVDIVEGH